MRTFNAFSRYPALRSSSCEGGVSTSMDSSRSSMDCGLGRGGGGLLWSDDFVPFERWGESSSNSITLVCKSLL